MPTDFLDLATTDCSDCIGGIVKTAVVDAAYIDFTGVTVDANGRITAFVMTTPGKVAELLYDTDDTAHFDSVGERNNNIHRNNQEAFMKFGCITADKIKAADLMRKNCKLVAVHLHASGLTSVQGIDVIEDGLGYKAVLSKTTAKATVTAMSGTGAEEDRIEVMINAVSRNVLVLLDTATITYEDFILL